MFSKAPATAAILFAAGATAFTGWMLWQGTEPAGDRPSTRSTIGAPHSRPDQVAYWDQGTGIHTAGSVIQEPLLPSMHAGTKGTLRSNQAVTGAALRAPRQMRTFGLSDSSALTLIGRRFAPPVIPRPAVIPVAFAEVPAEVQLLTHAQGRAVDRIQEQFIDEIGGEPADPARPEYLTRWRQAQPIADQRLRAAIGAQAFARWQEAVYLAASPYAASK